MNVEHAAVYGSIRGYDDNNTCIENEMMWYMGMVWTGRYRSD